MTHTSRRFDLTAEAVEYDRIVAAAQPSDELYGDHAFHQTMLGLVDVSHAAAPSLCSRSYGPTRGTPSVIRKYLIGGLLLNRIPTAKHRFPFRSRRFSLRQSLEARPRIS